jgi:hypothetical protein
MQKTVQYEEIQYEFVFGIIVSNMFWFSASAPLTAERSPDENRGGHSFCGNVQGCGRNPTIIPNIS